MVRSSAVDDLSRCKEKGSNGDGAMRFLCLGSAVLYYMMRDKVIRFDDGPKHWFSSAGRTDGRVSGNQGISML